MKIKERRVASEMQKYDSLYVKYITNFKDMETEELRKNTSDNGC